MPCGTDNLTLCLGCIRSHASCSWWDLFVLLSAQWCSPRPAPGLHHVGWHPAFTGLPPDLHLHLLLLPWAAERPQHDSQELVHQPLRGRAPLPHRHQPDWPAGKRQSPFCFCHRLLSQCICSAWPVGNIPAVSSFHAWVLTGLGPQLITEKSKTLSFQNSNTGTPILMPVVISGSVCVLLVNNVCACLISRLWKGAYTCTSSCVYLPGCVRGYLCIF